MNKEQFIKCLIFLIISLFFLIFLKLQQRDGFVREENKNLTIFNITKRPTFSLNPVDSDVLSNLIVMDQLVGTLVKYGHDGRYWPYLAEKWTVSNDKLKWNFYFRKNLICEDGTPINAHLYADGLRIVLNLLYKKSESSAFDYLVGINYIKNSEQKSDGIVVVNDYQLQFEFEREPQGLIEYLAQPYYGFYSINNFNKNGTWKDSKKIISSGHYQFAFWEGVNNPVLKRREGWFSNLADSPELVYLKNIPDIETIEIPKNYTIITNVVGEIAVPDNYTALTGTPEYLTALIISPYTNKIFHNKENRKKFKDNFRESDSLSVFNKDGSIRVDYFYKPNTRPKHTEVKSNLKLEGDLSNKKVTLVATGRLRHKTQETLIAVIRKSLENLGLELEFKDIDLNNSENLYSVRSNNKYDLRIATVNAGMFYENWVIQMMFCSKLGVSFIDIDSKICSLSKKIESEEVSLIEAEVIFENIIEDDSVVIPIFRTGYLSYFSNDIQVNNQSPTIATLRYDLLSTKR